MVGKPKHREADPNPNRADDVRFSAFGITIEASGKSVTYAVVGIVVVSMVAMFFYAHDSNATRDHRELQKNQQVIVDQLSTMTCVFTLDMNERKEYRENGKYCPQPPRRN